MHAGGSVRSNRSVAAMLAATWPRVIPFLFLLGLVPMAQPDGAVAAAAAQGTAIPAPPAADSLAAEEETEAPVVLDGQVLFHVVAIAGHPAERRAAGINRRLLEIARDRTLSPDSIAIVGTELGAEIRLGPRLIMMVFGPDAQLINAAPRTAATAYANVLRVELRRYRAAHSPNAIVGGFVKALLATVVLLFLLYLMTWIGRSLHRRAESWLAGREEAVATRTKHLVNLRHLMAATDTILHLAGLTLLLVALYTYLYFVLGCFPWTRHLSTHLFQLVSAPFSDFVAAFGRRVPGFIFVAFLAVATHYFLRFCRYFFRAIELGNIELKGFYPDWAMTTYKIAQILVVACAVVIAYPYIPGSETAAFKGISIFLGVLLSLGSTSGVSNVVAGVMLTYMRGLHVGDVVEIAGHRGKVIATSLLATRLRTPKNVEVTIPNATVMGAEVVNFSVMAREQRLILPTTANIGYTAPWRQVHAMLLQAAERTEGVLADPAPFVLQKSLDSFGVTYELNVYVGEAERMQRIYSDLHKNIQDVFNEYGVEIMTPAYEGDRDEPTVVPKDRWYAPPAKPPGAPGADV